MPASRAGSSCHHVSWRKDAMKRISKNSVDNQRDQSTKILLAIDDSKFSEAAIETLVAQNNPSKTTVRVLHVVEPLETPYYPDLAPPYPASLDDIRTIRLKAGRELVARATEKVRASGLPGRWCRASGLCPNHCG